MIIRSGNISSITHSERDWPDFLLDLPPLDLVYLDLNGKLVGLIEMFTNFQSSLDFSVFRANCESLGLISFVKGHRRRNGLLFFKGIKRINPRDNLKESNLT